MGFLMSEETVNKCCECEEIVDTESDFGWSTVKEDYLCWGCYESDQNYASTLHVIDDGAVLKYYIGDHVRMDEYGDDMFRTNITVNREYVHSSAWRGYFNTTIEGWTQVMDGWTTGGWGDPIAERKQTFNEWAESLMTGELVPPVPVAIVADPTSNVFSMGISVLTPEPAKLKEWIYGDFEALYGALS
jgi:hypothetical protein